MGKPGDDLVSMHNLCCKLQDEVASLKARLKRANDRLAQYDRVDNNRYRYESDYLPYEDDRYE
jgi:hypothetical protein